MDKYDSGSDSDTCLCSMTVFDNWFDTKKSVLPIYKKLIAAGLRIWVYRYTYATLTFIRFEHKFGANLSTNFVIAEILMEEFRFFRQDTV